jgi:hypothetical protein
MSRATRAPISPHPELDDPGSEHYLPANSDDNPSAGGKSGFALFQPTQRVIFCLSNFKT